MQGDAKLAQDLLSLRKNVVEEKHEYVFDNCAGLAQRLAEIHLAATVSGHVLDQEHAIAGLDMALDLRIAAKPFGFLRTYCIGSIRRSAIQAAKGIPAVSPPATPSNCSKPTSRISVATPKSISCWRTRGKEISRRQSV